MVKWKAARNPRPFKRQSDEASPAFVFSVFLVMVASLGLFISYTHYDINRQLNPEPAPDLYITDSARSEIDNRVRLSVGQKFDDPKALARFLASQYDDKAHKVYAIYRWITSNISYDFISLREGTINSSATAEHAFIKGKAVCQGYAELFVIMAKAVGFNAKVVVGHASDDPRVQLISSREEYENHAWNIVRINGYWYPLDATWDTGYVNEELTDFTWNQEGWQYFLVAPETFGKDHIATNKNENLLPMPTLQGTALWWSKALAGKSVSEALEDKSWTSFQALAEAVNRIAAGEFSALITSFSGNEP